MKSTLIIQPWFSANGHPAQSVINSARILVDESYFSYLVSCITKSDRDIKNFNLLQSIVKANKFAVNSSSLREGTYKSIFAVRNYLKKNPSVEKLFYFDVHLVLMALIWPLFRPGNIRQLYVCYLMGPERVKRFRLINFVIAQFLKRHDVVLFLRTQELAHDWKKDFPNADIRCLPSLEISEVTIEPPKNQAVVHSQIQLGVLGQIRLGKGIEWLVPLFQTYPHLGDLNICGAYSDQAAEIKLNNLKSYPTFINKFLSENELLGLAAEQDYLLMLYDDWDPRMEGAVMFLAAKVSKPVIVYDEGWCGRMVRTYNNGLVAPKNKNEMMDFFKGLPKPGSDVYQQLLSGVISFKCEHSGDKLKNAFLEAFRD